jgi:transposase InsO family protein
MKHASPYLKMRVLGALDTAPGRTRHERVHQVAAMTFVDEDGTPRSFTWRTIQTWWYRYKNYGITDMTPQPRSDKGHPRRVTPEELLEAINAVLPTFRPKDPKNRHHAKTPTKTAIYRRCIEMGLLQKDQIARTTFSRYVRQYDLLKPDPNERNKRRLAFSMQYVNQLWQADTMVGPFVRDGHGSRQTKLIAFIDDASRVICHAEFFFEENTDTLVRALKAAFYKRGLAEQLLVDHGSVYCSQEITLVCARLGVILRHTPVRDAAAKGKIERWFRRLRGQFLIRQLDLSSLEALNRQLFDWVENEYNAALHSAIGMKPIDRFGLDLKRIRYLPPSETNDELFFAEETRKVKKDNTFSFRNIRYETPVDLADREIEIRYERHRPGPVIVYYKGQRMGPAQLLDRIANGLLRRKED